MNKAYLLIGGNMGNREGYLAAARKQIENIGGKIITASSLYQTAAWGLENQDTFLNQALLVETDFDAPQLLQKLLGIEEQIGRKRERKYGPRIIDIDILLFNDEVINTEGLHVPHPQMQNRRFVLEPLNEIAGDVMHPAFHKSIWQLLAECPDKLAVQKFQ